LKHGKAHQSSQLSIMDDEKFAQRPIFLLYSNYQYFELMGNRVTTSTNFILEINVTIPLDENTTSEIIPSHTQYLQHQLKAP
jgi:hypothetical protein